jgi:hypothetical protein
MTNAPIAMTTVPHREDVREREPVRSSPAVDEPREARVGHRSRVRVRLRHAAGLVHRRRSRRASSRRWRGSRGDSGTCRRPRPARPRSVGSALLRPPGARTTRPTARTPPSRASSTAGRTRGTRPPGARSRPGTARLREGRSPRLPQAAAEGKAEGDRHDDRQGENHARRRDVGGRRPRPVPAS